MAIEHGDYLMMTPEAIARREERERRREQRQTANDALMAFTTPGTNAVEIRANLLIVEQLVMGCRNLAKDDDGWTMGDTPDPDEGQYHYPIVNEQIALAEKLLIFTKQTVQYRAGNIFITFEWKEPV